MRWTFGLEAKNARVFASRKVRPLAGIACTNDTSYQDIVPNRRIVFASTMSRGRTVHLGVAGHG